MYIVFKNIDNKDTIESERDCSGWSYNVNKKTDRLI